MKNKVLANVDNLDLSEKPSEETFGITDDMDNDEKLVSIVFYVNDTLYDKASTDNKNVANDFDILSGVLYVIILYLQKSKINHAKFEAYSGEGDTKTVRNLPTEKIIATILKSCAPKPV